MDEVLELCSTHLRTEDIYNDLQFPEGKDGRPYAAINVVSSLDGKATLGGRAGGIGTGFDHNLMRRVRAATDLVLVGANTLRAENINFCLTEELQRRRVVQGKSPAPLAAVLSASGDLPLDRTFFQSKEFESIVFVSGRADPRRVQEMEKYARVIVVGQDTVDIKQLAGILWHDLGIRRMTVEGGPGLNYAFIANGLADELFLTVAPKVVAGREITPVEGPSLPGVRAVDLELISAYAHQSELYLRYRFVS